MNQIRDYLTADRYKVDQYNLYFCATFLLAKEEVVMFGVNHNTQNVIMLSDILKGNPEGLFKKMYENNPEFKKFVDENKDLSAEEIAKKYGIPIK